MTKIGADFVRSILGYDPHTGIFRWKDRSTASASWNAKYAGKPAGSSQRGRPVTIEINNRPHKAHRLAWLMMTGEWPSSEVDHRDTDPANNRWANLRLATPSQNGCNRRAHVDNTSGYKGVSWDKGKKKWQATIMKDGRQRHLGRFSNPEDAHAAYCAAAAELHGEFARQA